LTGKPEGFSTSIYTKRLAILRQLTRRSRYEISAICLTKVGQSAVVYASY